ncbi:hypothetical protein ISF_01739 [Cordyceps fumosorosea ARSEF 2679]|uniref:Uncharacterized protein n=1 Tax=Cordyceps fumosorosea (strain ARSEF 2679) TaxID=1081104 RepID=A0A162KEK8_CORFA|nr:hypothetical protein ISF_01739 [Cordyceps fumosorosea ARSEF 2679]OAA71188.1 hypothetical protein ISF_01739 [Cordyceps fumosorosea ARSEF 2679]
MSARLLVHFLALAPMALAGTIQYPEVVPGPGLPSLQELGLTTEQLYSMGPPEPADLEAFSANFVGKCGPADAAYTNVNGIIACYHYLKNLGTQRCTTPGNYKSIEFCHSGDASITGTSLKSNGASSYCRDVASGLLWVVDHCTRPNQSCAGAQAAGGNGNLVVFGGSKKWTGFITAWVDLA